MKYELNGKVAIVVGGGGSTGSAACKMLAANGAKVVVAGRTLETLNAVVKEIAAQGGTAIAATADVTSTESMHALVDAAVKAFGRVDAMVNCAGVRGRLEKRNPLQDYDDDLWEAVISTEMTGAYHAIKAAAKQMVEQGQGGSLITVGSAMGLVPIKLQCAYSAAKAGVFNFTKAVAMELGPEKIRCNAIASGETLNDELKALITAGVGTFVCMHMDADIVKALQEDNRCNVLCMGHMASDSIGFNQILDAWEARGVEVTRIGGLV